MVGNKHVHPGKRGRCGRAEGRDGQGRAGPDPRAFIGQRFGAAGGKDRCQKGLIREQKRFGFRRQGLQVLFVGGN